MEFRCSECGHIGPADSVAPSEEGVQLECAECGATSTLDVDEDSDSADEGEDEPETSGGTNHEDVAASGAASGGVQRRTFDAADRGPGEGSESTASGSQPLQLSGDEAIDRLMPEEGPGIRCPKCAKLLRADAENCVRCGLDLEEARRYDDGEAPWEQPTPGKEAAHERAELLWEAFLQDRDPDELEKFVNFVDTEGLYEMAIRKVRFYLVDFPDDEAGREALYDLAMGVQSKIASARAKAEVDAEELNAEIQDFKRKLIVAVLGLWIFAVVLFVYIFWW